MTLRIKVKNGNSLTIQPSSNFRIAVVASILAWVFKKKLSLADGRNNDEFGNSVALDGTRALVGAPGRGDGIGAAYIYDLSGGNWTLTTDISLGADVAGLPPAFGVSVALDEGRALVGAPDYDGPNKFYDYKQGAVYIYDLSRGNWTRTADISLGTDGGNNDQFGDSVALDGSRALVGAPGRGEFVGERKGAAYIYDTNDGINWTLTTDISLGTDGSGGDTFGTSVALDGSRALVGAPGRDNDKGAAYIYDLNGGNWTLTTDISLGTDGGNNDQFGFSVALDGSRALVGAPGRGEFVGERKGAAYIYDTNDGINWTLTTDISLGTGGSGGDSFGNSVALDGNRALVGAPGRDGPNVPIKGAAYIYDTNDGSKWTQTTDISLADGGNNDQFGDSVALDGNRALVGAYGRDGPNVPNKGAAYIYDYERTN